MAVAFFPGSFDPFTEGHRSVVERMSPLFDRIVIGIGINKSKQRWQPVDESKAYIESLFPSEAVSVVPYSCLTIEAAKQQHADVIIKGVRDIIDFQYELHQADINRRIGQIETVFVPSTPELSAMSSSVVRELKSFGYDNI